MTEIIALPNKNLFAPVEVSTHLGVAVSTVYNWIESGELKAVRVGKKLIRVRRVDLLEMVTVSHPGEVDLDGIREAGGFVKLMR